MQRFSALSTVEILGLVAFGLLLGAALGITATWLYYDRSISASSSSPTVAPTATHTLVQTHGMLPLTVGARDVEVSVLEARLMDSCGGQSALFAPGYRLLSLLVRMSNRTDFILPFSFTLRDSVDNVFREPATPDAGDCFQPPRQRIFVVSPGETVEGPVLFALPPAALDARLHLQWQSDALLLTMDLFPNREAIREVP